VEWTGMKRQHLAPDVAQLALCFGEILGSLCRLLCARKRQCLDSFPIDLGVGGPWDI
jgi:hypothetical protein